MKSFNAVPMDIEKSIVAGTDLLIGLLPSLHDVASNSLSLAPLYPISGGLRANSADSKISGSRPIVGTDAQLLDRSLYDNKPVISVEYKSIAESDLLVGSRGFVLVPLELPIPNDSLEQMANLNAMQSPIQVALHHPDKVSPREPLKNDGVIRFYDGNGFAKGNNNTNGNGAANNKFASSNKKEIFITGNPNQYSSKYNFKVIFKGGWQNRIKNQFKKAATNLAKKFRDVLDIPGFENGVDDINVHATVNGIDGRGGILGNARVTHIRSSNRLPVRAEIRLDKADFSRLSNKGIQELVTHELMHTMGFGVLWKTKGLLKTQNSNYFFTGKRANKVFRKEFPSIAKEFGQIPVERNGGPGTAGSHWLESAFDNELMTGYLDFGKNNYLSKMSIEAMKDIGYR